MNLFKAFSSKKEPEEVPDEPINTAALTAPRTVPSVVETPANPPPPVFKPAGGGQEPLLTPPETPALQAIQDEVVKSIKTCFDPEIPVNIYALGLVYDILVSPLPEDTAEVVVRMTLTSPSCPAAGSLPGEVQFKAGAVAGVTSSRVELVWEPPWNPNLMSEAAKLQLGLL
jgi:FeS assembly SUF system protein